MGLFFSSQVFLLQNVDLIRNGGIGAGILSRDYGNGGVGGIRGALDDNVDFADGAFRNGLAVNHEYLGVAIVGEGAHAANGQDAVLAEGGLRSGYRGAHAGNVELAAHEANVLIEALEGLEMLLLVSVAVRSVGSPLTKAL